MLAYTPVEFNYEENLAKTFIIPSKLNQFIQENISNNAPARRITIAMNTNSAVTGPYTENPFWYQQFNHWKNGILKSGQSFVDSDAADNFRLYVTTMKALNFQDDFPSIPIDNFKDHYVLVFDLTSMQNASENFHYPELVGEPLSLVLNFNFPLEHLLNSLCCENECLRLQFKSLVFFREKHLKWLMFLSSKEATISYYSGIGAVVLFPLIMFQLLIMTLLLL